MANDQKEKIKVKVPTALKRDLQNERKRIRNRAYKAKVRTVVREFETALTGTDSALTVESLNATYSVLDRAAKRGVITKNKANRSKARLAARLAVAK